MNLDDLNLESKDEMMQYIDLGDPQFSSEFEFSEDGASSVTSSVEIPFEPLDYDVLNNMQPIESLGPLNSLNLQNMPQNLRQIDVRNQHMNQMNQLQSQGMQSIQSQRPQVETPTSHSNQIVGQTDNQHMKSQLVQQNQNMGWNPEFGEKNFDNEGEVIDTLMEKLSFGPVNNVQTSPQFIDKAIVSRPQLWRNLKYSLELEKFPEKSRVETQIKCTLIIKNTRTNSPPEETLLHLPADTIARPRFQLANPQILHEDATLRAATLYLSVDAINPHSPNENILMCTKCLAREKKRAFRKKTMDPNEEHYWNESKMRRIIIINGKEVIPIKDGGIVELPLRIACYCRHHAAKSGYQLLFSLRSASGELLGATVSTSIFITDSHKEQRRLSTTSSVESAESSSHESTSVSRLHRVSSASSNDIHGSHPYMRRMRPEQNRSSPSNILNVSRSRSNSQSQSPGNIGGIDMQNIQQSQNSGGYVKREPPSPSSAIPSWMAGVPNGMSPNMGAQAIPTVIRAIPPTGSVRGGIEVTLLGNNFRPGLVAMFGEAAAVSTQFWSDTTIIAHLPASTQSGPVLVQFQGFEDSWEHAQASPATFTYINDGDGKLKEIALQMIGFDMTGKVEDADNIAQQLLIRDGNSKSNSKNNSASDTNSHNATFHSTQPICSAEKFALWVLENLSKFNTERLSNINLRNAEGQSMIHIASMLGYTSVVKALIMRGAYVDIQDVSGLTPLHFAVMFGNRSITRLLLMADADPFRRTLSNQIARDIADSTVIDLLPVNARTWYNELNTRGSSGSLHYLLRQYEDNSSSVPAISSAASSAMGTSNVSVNTNSATPSGGLGRASSETTLSFTSLDPSEDDGYDSTGSEEDSAPNVRPKRPPSYSRLFPAQEFENESTANETSNDAENRQNSRANHTSNAEASEFKTMKNKPESVLRFGYSFTKKPLNSQLKNDRMLFTFWVPLLLVTLLALLTIYMMQNEHNGVEGYVVMACAHVGDWSKKLLYWILPGSQFQHGKSGIKVA
ncbi:Mga2 protein [Starmerella bacillaris]|uniref:Mga2 protein n=1 Tax=Starmerella bacillaris TaxID=1247836 RepID=A0AAV5RKR6_STABA|nr:Mga2 protein [Starmerella bacillaris]